LVMLSLNATEPVGAIGLVPFGVVMVAVIVTDALTEEVGGVPVLELLTMTVVVGGVIR
jgi:hypothetical protein